MLALLVACALGQASSDPVLSQRTWLFASLKSDLEAKGQTDPAQLQTAREQIGRLTPDELQTLVNLYQQLKQGTTPARSIPKLSATTTSPCSRAINCGWNPNPDSHLPARSASRTAAMLAWRSSATHSMADCRRLAWCRGAMAARNRCQWRTGVALFRRRPLPYAGPMGFGTFSASGPVNGYNAPFVPGGSPGPMPFGY